MADTTNKTQTKRPAKGQRTHLRRLKEAARHEGSTYPLRKVRRATVPKTEM